MADHPTHQELFADDRGRARYFHGRDRIINRFNALCQSALEDKGGTIFLIQGSPGAGKTALLQELCAHARKAKWHVAAISPPDLREYTKMAATLDITITTRTQTHWEIDAKLGSGDSSYDKPGVSAVSSVLSQAVPRAAGLILELDEAQELSDFADVPETSDIKATIKAIHNGQLGRPVILLAGGLGLTKRAFKDLGVSRFRSGCLAYLGRLSADSERAVIRDWLIKGGDARGDVEPWVDAIAQETDGWPQHIINFAEPASQVIRQSRGVMTPQDLIRVLDDGRLRKDQYYKGRVEDILPKDQVLLGAIIAYSGKGAVWDPEEFREALDTRQRRDGVSGSDVADIALARGVLASTVDGLHIPIPSMEDWLVWRYETYLTSRPVAAQALVARLQPILPQLGGSTKTLPPAPDSGHPGPTQGLNSGFGSPDDGIER